MRIVTILAALVLCVAFIAMGQEKAGPATRPIPFFYVTYTENRANTEELQIVSGAKVIFDFENSKVHISNQNTPAALRFANKSIEQASRYLSRSVDINTVELGADAVYNVEKNEFVVNGVAVAVAPEEQK